MSKRIASIVNSGEFNDATSKITLKVAREGAPPPTDFGAVWVNYVPYGGQIELRPVVQYALRPSEIHDLITIPNFTPAQSPKRISVFHVPHAGAGGTGKA